MTDGRDLPWIQDTTDANVQGAFGAEYREVVILDAWNRPLQLAKSFNLTELDLALASNRGALKELLRLTAEMTDEDGNGIADDWEERYLGGVGNSPGSDIDGDAGDLLLEYGLGSNPGERGSLPTITTGTMDVEGETRLSLSFRRRMGLAGGLSYVLETREAGGDWSDAGAAFEIAGVENPYDGTGTEIVTFVATGEVAEGALYRVRVVLP